MIDRRASAPLSIHLIMDWRIGLVANEFAALAGLLAENECNCMGNFLTGIPSPETRLAHVTNSPEGPDVGRRIHPRIRRSGTG
jgi:hypothetical protein